MVQDFKKGVYALGIWLAPILLVLLEAAFFLSKLNWGSDFIPYFITFWALRAALAPLIVAYTKKFWIDHRKWFRLFLVHALGFMLFSLLFWSLAYLILNNMLHRNEFFGVERTSTDIHVFGMIVDNSVSTNTVVYVSTVAFCYSWEFFRQNVSVTKKAMDLEKSLLTSKLELLKSQINTHFLFNTLHTISSLVVRQQNEEANKMLVRLSELLRFALKENKDQLIPLHKELELLNLYLDIQKIRFKDRLQINMNVQQGNTDAMVPALLLQPIVENAVKYGIEPYSEKGYVDIDITSDENQLSLTIKDSGKKSFEEINFDSGIGLTNTKDRLEKLYNGKHQFSIHPNSTTGVAVSIQIPKHAHAAFENPNS